MSGIFRGVRGLPAWFFAEYVFTHGEEMLYLRFFEEAVDALPHAGGLPTQTIAFQQAEFDVASEGAARYTDKLRGLAYGKELLNREFRWGVALFRKLHNLDFVPAGADATTCELHITRAYIPTMQQCSGMRTPAAQDMGGLFGGDSPVRHGLQDFFFEVRVMRLLIEHFTRINDTRYVVQTRTISSYERAWNTAGQIEDGAFIVFVRFPHVGGKYLLRGVRNENFDKM